MAEKSLAIIISARDRASKEFRKLRSELEALNQAGSNLQDIGGAMLGVGGSLAAGLGLAAKTAADFEHAVIQLGSVMERQVGQMGDLEKAARQLGQSNTKGATQTAEAMKIVAAYGYELADVIKITQVATKLATAQNYDLNMSTEILISTFKNFQKQGYEVAEVADILTRASNISSASMEKFRYSLKYIAPTATALNRPLEEMVAQLSLLYDYGLSAETAGTALRGVFERLMSPTARAVDILEQYGITVDQINPKVHSLAQIIDLFNKKGVETKDVYDIFGVETANAFLAFQNMGAEALDTYTKKLQQASGATEEMYKVQMSSFNNQAKLLGSQLEELGISLGMVLLPYLKELVQVLQVVLRWVNGLSDSTKRAIVLSGVVGSAFFMMAGAVLYLGGAFLIAVASMKEFANILGGIVKHAKTSKVLQNLVRAIAPLRTSFASLSAPMLGLVSSLGRLGKVGLIILAIIAVLALLYFAWKNNWLGIRDIFDKVSQWIIEKYNQLKTATMAFVNSVKTWWSNLDLLGTLQSIWGGVAEWVSSLWGSIKDTVYNFLLGILMDTGQTQEEARQTLEKAWNNIKTFFVGIFNFLKFLFYDSWIQMGAAVWNGINMIWSLTQTWGSQLITWAITFWDKFINLVSQAWNGIKTVIMTFFNWLSPYFNAAWSQVMVPVMAFANWIKPYISQAWNFISSVISVSLNFIKGIVKAVWNGVKAFTQTTWNNIKNIVNNAINIIKNVIALAINLIAGNWKGAWNNVQNITRSSLNIIKTIVTGGLDAVINAMKSFASTAKNAGKALMEAFANGIKSAASKVTSEVQSVVSKARRFFGFSDAKEGPFSNITHSGYATMAAFAKGATQAQNLLTRKVGGTIHGALAGGTAGLFGINQVQPALAGSPSPAPTNINVTININGEGNEALDLLRNPQRLARIVAEEIQKEMRR